ncbi:MAG: TolC family protein [Deltaproteobacteria bacterium]|nr:TolC family protein [Deltaproteobacteria bacterium]
MPTHAASTRWSRALPACLLALAAMAAAFSCKAAAAGLPSDLQALIREALAANQDLKRLDGLKTASREAAGAAGSLEDPMLSFQLRDIPTDTWSFKQDDMTQKMVMVSQKFPFPGKRRLRTEVAEEQHRADGLVYRDKANEVRARVVQNYWSLALAQASYALTEKNKKFWEQVVQVAETRYSVGQGSQADVLQAQVELGNYLDRLLKFRQQELSVQAELNALRSRPPGTPLPRPPALTARPLTLKLEDLLGQAESSPQLQSLKTVVAKQEKAVALARKESFPDLTLALSYGFRENRGDLKRADMFSSTVSINLPIWQRSRIQPQIREQQARREAAQAEHQAQSNRLAAAVKDRHARLQRLSQQIKLMSQGILPQARQAAQAVLASYQVGTADFTQLYQAQITVLGAELQLQDYLKEFEENYAELEWLVGQELPRPGGGRP